MNTPNDWVNNYLTPEEQQKMAELSRQSYSPAAAQKIAQWGQNWTGEDQQRVSQQWNAVFAELKRLAVEGKDPASPEAQALARQHQELVQQFTGVMPKSRQA
uniref:TipAS antibiotic-recognition domain-containing protein n=1 Tax=Thermosporothrix sp. COM3 TaxID=2490863 RepID=A0A455SDF1_9CHLR|nr:hypothetical protein KTC_02610 [Thermosporothrix sp. COM3]